MKAREKFINKKFGKLLVLSNAGATPAGHLKWNCLCDCGNSCIRTGTSLIRSKNSSCGCFKLQGKDNPLWSGVGDISYNWFSERIVRAADGSKGGRKIKEVNITIEYLWDLFLKQNRKCKYTGIELFFPKVSSNRGFKESTASLDRIDSSKGYIAGNVQWVHKNVNKMKNTFSHEYFIKMCKLITANNCEIL